MEGCAIKLDRLFGITTYLLNHKIVSARTLADRFEVSKRTIQRDIDALCLAGIPIITHHGSGGGYSVSEKFSLDKQIYSREDYQNIIIALKGFCSAYIKGKADPTLEKVLSTVSSLRQSVVLDFGALREGGDLERTFSSLEEAILTETIVEIDYSDAEGRVSTRQVEPLLLTYKWYSWYLLAYCQKKGDYRLFKLPRIIRIEHKNMPFSIRHMDAAQILDECISKDTRRYFKIRLYCKAAVRQQVLEYLNGSISEELEDGAFIYELQLPEKERMWFSIIMGFGDQVAVLEPDEIKNKLLDTANKIIKIYNS